MSAVPRAVVLRPADIPWEELGVEGEQAQIRPVVGTDVSDSMAAGLCRFTRTRFAWQLTYDECIHVLEGRMEVRREGEPPLVADAGEVIHLPRGSDVEYVIADRCVLFYAAYPVDWQERMEADGG
jgi:ethanolamine utilization protein EutQ